MKFNGITLHENFQFYGNHLKASHILVFTSRSYQK